MSDQNQDRNDHPELEPFFDAARREMPDPSEALMARVLADAMAAQVGSRVSAHAGSHLPVRIKPRRVPLWMQLRDALGGWPALGGLATAGVTGLFVGFSAPVAFGDVTVALLGQSAQTDGYLVDLMPELDFDVAMDPSEG